MNDTTNYQVVLNQMLEDIQTLQKKPKLLLHSCCAPCSSYVLEYLSKYFQITILYYNPNIYPEEEYVRRKKELEKFLAKAHYEAISFLEEAYNQKEFYQSIKGYENLGERSERCFQCYELRMRKVAERAKKEGFDYFTTTLSISPHKDAKKINEIGARLEQELGISYLYADFKKKGGYLRSLELSKEYDLYRQDYCGCVYSKEERKIHEN